MHEVFTEDDLPKRKDASPVSGTPTDSRIKGPFNYYLNLITDYIEGKGDLQEETGDASLQENGAEAAANEAGQETGRKAHPNYPGLVEKLKADNDRKLRIVCDSEDGTFQVMAGKGLYSLNGRGMALADIMAAFDEAGVQRPKFTTEVKAAAPTKKQLAEFNMGVKSPFGDFGYTDGRMALFDWPFSEPMPRSALERTIECSVEGDTLIFAGNRLALPDRKMRIAGSIPTEDDTLVALYDAKGAARVSFRRNACASFSRQQKAMPNLAGLAGIMRPLLSVITERLSVWPCR